MENDRLLAAGQNLCQYLDWDSNFFGIRIARVIPEVIDETHFHYIQHYCEQNQIDCLYFLGDISDHTSIRLAEKNNFELVDIRKTFENRRLGCASSSQANTVGETHNWTEADIVSLREIAKISYRDTRFYFDNHFSVAKADELYATWIEKSCRGYADKVLVAKINKQVAGYISCHLISKLEGQIGLIGVHPDFRGKGLGTTLVSKAHQWFVENKVENVRVVTQGRNIQAQRLYEKCGFLTKSVQIWYHRWFDWKVQVKV